MHQAHSMYYDRGGAPVDLETYLHLRADESYRVVARELVRDGIIVCTAWLGTDHSPGRRGQPPLVFGTAAPLPGTHGELFADIELLGAILEEALANQRDLVARVRSSLP